MRFNMLAQTHRPFECRPGPQAAPEYAEFWGGGCPFIFLLLAVHTSPVQPPFHHCILLPSAEPCGLQGVLEPGAEEELQLTVWINGGSEGTAQLVAGTQVGPAGLWVRCTGFTTRVAVMGRPA